MKTSDFESPHPPTGFRGRPRLLPSRLAVGLFCLLAPFASAATFEFTKHTINPDSRFEACGVADINNDGRLDVLSGDTWYEATGDASDPWKPHKICEIKEDGGYHHDFANELLDVNGDGRLDVLSCTWHTRSVIWREQPATPGEEWKTHSVEEIGNMETGFSADINKDGLIDFFPQVAQKTVWYERLKTPKDGEYWKRHDVGENAGHGGGVGDVDADGDMDIVVRGGWYEQTGESWNWHGEFELGAACIPILVHDFTADGLPDVVWGMGHDYGVYWLEQARDADGKRSWNRHVIDESWSQAHTMELGDFDEDGVPEVVTGKRYFAHNGHDPGGKEPLIVCIYSWNAGKKSFDRHVIDEKTRTGGGLRVIVQDLDADGDLDFVTPGKSGLYWFENRLK